MLKEYFKGKNGMEYRYYFTTFNNQMDARTLTALTFKYDFPEDFRPALKEIWDKVNEIRLE